MLLCFAIPFWASVIWHLRTFPVLPVPGVGPYRAWIPTQPTQPTQPFFDAPAAWAATAVMLPGYSSSAHAVIPWPMATQPRR